MRTYSWLQALHLSFKRATARRPQRILAQLEHLEDRTVPVVITCDLGTGLLSVSLDPGEMAVSIHSAAPESPIVVTVDGIDHVGDGTDPANPGFECNAQDVNSIFVDAESNNTENNLIDLSDALGDQVSMLVHPVRIAFPVTIQGGLGNDTIIGSMAGVFGDSISGGAGDDSIAGNGGNDSISGGDGNDTLDGGNGFDALSGDAGDDSLLGGNDGDTLLGGDGNDVQDGNDGDDFVSGGFGSDTLHGGAGDDFVFGDAGDDKAFGDDGNDQVSGGSDNDTLDGGMGTDTVFGDDGDDILVWSTFDATETGDGGSDTSDSGGPGDTVSVVGTARTDALTAIQPAASTWQIMAGTGVTFTVTTTENITLTPGSASAAVAASGTAAAAAGIGAAAGLGVEVSAGPSLDAGVGLGAGAAISAGVAGGMISWRPSCECCCPCSPGPVGLETGAGTGAMIAS